jgi:hypothetical protein
MRHLNVVRANARRLVLISWVLFSSPHEAESTWQSKISRVAYRREAGHAYLAVSEGTTPKTLVWRLPLPQNSNSSES